MPGRHGCQRAAATASNRSARFNNLAARLGKERPRLRMQQHGSRAKGKERFGLTTNHSKRPCQWRPTRCNAASYRTRRSTAYAGDSRRHASMAAGVPRTRRLRPVTSDSVAYANPARHIQRRAITARCTSSNAGWRRGIHGPPDDRVMHRDLQGQSRCRKFPASWLAKDLGHRLDNPLEPRKKRGPQAPFLRRADAAPQDRLRASRITWR